MVFEYLYYLLEVVVVGLGLVIVFELLVVEDLVVG